MKTLPRGPEWLDYAREHRRRSMIARDAVEGAIAHVGCDASLETIIREALRRCPRPNA